MPISTPRAIVAGLATAGLAASLVVAAPGAQAAPKTAPKAAPKAASTQKSDVRELPLGKKYSTAKLSLGKQAKAKARAAAAGSPPVGTKRTLVALDDYNGVLYRKTYTLKAVGAHIEVYVADDTAFPAGDCRLQVPNTTTVTTAQAKSLADQFDNNMFPKESQAFSVAPSRNGSGNVVSGVDPSGDGAKIMTLVDNVRDDNYYLGVNQAPTYIAGFFSSQFNELLDRNIMTIDAFDWLHRTGANPPDNTTTDLCTSRAARPRLYEGTFAHEYQHLLEYYQDPSEVSWVNEGLSDFAQTLVGYVDARLTVEQKGADSHIYCYQGFGIVQTKYNANPRDCGGPQNSLTLWGDDFGNANAILADYGEAYSFMLFLYDRYGIGFMSRLHRDGADQGLVGLQHALDGYDPGADVYDVLHDFQTATLVDRYLDTTAGSVSGRAKAKITSGSLNSTVNLGNPASYAQPGVAANGADYVGLRGSSGLYLRGQDLDSVDFSGSRQLVPQPLAWTSVANPPKQTGDAALWSGNTSNLDATAVTTVNVPAGSPKLTFNEYHLAEATYDYAYTVVSTDGGKTYKALSNANTVAGPLGPALNGDAAGWAAQTFDLTPYAGKSIVVGFRYVSDGGTNDGGWYVDDVKVGSTTLNTGTSTAPFQSATQLRPSSVYSYTVRLVGLDTAAHKAAVITLRRFAFSLTPDQIATLRQFPRVVAIVSYDEPTEQLQTQALYALTVNGVVQPGGGQSDAAAVRVRADRF